MRELTDVEVEQVSGGVEVNWPLFTTGLAMVGLGVAVASAAGLALLPVGVILGAGTVGEIGVGAFAAGLAGGGGYVSGSSLSVGGGGGTGGGSDRVHN